MLIFCDDTEFLRHRTHGEKLIGFGCLAVELDVSSGIVEKAMASLNADPDRINPKTKAADDRTLARGYFHAADDSANAHSPLCRQINQQLVGDFNYGYVRAASQDVLDLAREQALQYVGVIASVSREPVRLIVEASSLLSKHKIDETFEQVRRGIELGVDRFYAIPSLFPRIDVELAGKSCPGLQLVDFMLWANNRAHFSTPDERWRNRLEATIRTDIGGGDDGLFQGTYNFKKSVRSYAEYNYQAEIFPLAELSGREELEVVAGEMLQRTASVLNSRLASEVNHLEHARRRAIAALERAAFRITIDSARALASFFVRMFDMKPLYSPSEFTDKVSMTLLLKAKRLAGKLLNPTIESVRLIDLISARYHFFEVKRGELDLVTGVK